MTTRPAVAEDAALIAGVFAACWRTAYPGLVPTPVIERVIREGPELWSDLLKPGAGDWSVVVWGPSGITEGVVRFGRDPDDSQNGHVYSLYVHPDAGRRGIGAALLGVAQRWFADNGLDRATLWVFEGNRAARDFYSLMGWRPDGTERVEAAFDTPEVRLSWQSLAADLAELETERSRPELSALDTLPVAELVRLMNAEDARVPRAVGAKAAAISAAIDAVVERLRGGGRLIYIGAGTAGRLGILDASECIPTFNAEEGQVLGLIAGGGGAVAKAVEAAEDDKGAGADDLRAIALSARDVVVGVSASGRTPYVLGAIDYANKVGAASIGVACNANTPLGAAAKHPIEIAVGPELIAGSTRLKSGTAQKLVLNMISTIAMVRMGKTYGNLMIDVRPSNAKLRARARRIVQEAAGVDAAAAGRALAEGAGEVKTAVIMLRINVAAAEARRLLEQSGGNLRVALEGIR